MQKAFSGICTLQWNRVRQQRTFPRPLIGCTKPFVNTSGPAHCAPDVPARHNKWPSEQLGWIGRPELLARLLDLRSVPDLRPADVNFKTAALTEMVDDLIAGKLDRSNRLKALGAALCPARCWLSGETLIHDNKPCGR